MKDKHQVVKSILLMLILSPFFFSFAAYAHTPPPSEPHLSQKPKTQLEAVSLQLKWFHQFQFAGYYAAKIKGFYKDEGLDVTIKPRDMFVNNIQQVINGDSEYGIADSMLMLYQAQNAPLTIVSPIFQHSPQVLMTLKSSGINSLYDLNNKTIAFYKKDTDGFPILAMLHHNKIRPNFDRMTLKAGPQMLQNGQVQAYPGYLSNEVYYFKKNGIPINIFNPMNYGIDLYGDLIFTNNNELKNHPKRVEAFKRASIKGWEYALKHKEEIINYLINTLKVDKTYDHLMYEARVIDEAIKPNSIPIGTVDQGRLEFIKNLFVTHNLIQKKFDITQSIYQNQTPEALLTDKEIAWIKAHPTVKVAIDHNWAPFDFINQKGEFDGIAKDYLNYLSTFTGIQFIPEKSLTWHQAVEAVKNRELDLFSAVVTTPERSQYVNFTQPYLNFPMVIATIKGENYINNLNRLEGKTIAVGKNYVAHELLKKHYPKIKLRLVDDPAKGLESVSQGHAFAYIDNAAVIAYNIRSLGFSNIQITGETEFKANVSMAIRKDWPELHSIIQKTLDRMPPKLKSQISNRWLKVEYQQQIEWRRVGIIAIPMLVVVVIILLYTRRLRAVNTRLQATNQQLVKAQNTLEVANSQLEKLSITDFLTGVYNRKYIDQMLQSEINLSNRNQAPFSILLMDLDNFKLINDQYGHLVGDEVLKSVCRNINEKIRISDTLGRWGGEEFILICPTTDENQATLLADKILQSVRHIKFHEGFTQTISIGIATHKHQQSALSLLDKADSCLYQAKQQGKNQVVSELHLPKE